jgi:hypothetical protein
LNLFVFKKEEGEMKFLKNLLTWFKKNNPQPKKNKKQTVEDFWAASTKKMLQDGEIIYQKVVKSKERLTIKIAMKSEIPQAWLEWLQNFRVCFSLAKNINIFYKVEAVKQMGNFGYLELTKRGLSKFKEGQNLNKKKEEYFPSDIKSVHFIDSGGKIVYQFSVK